jgi:hypothetical protein
MALDFLQSSDGAWRAEGRRRHYRISLVREALRSKFRVFVSLDGERGSGTQAITGLHETLEAAIAWCEDAEQGTPGQDSALERKQRG